jgi:hypothetical protein
VEQRREGFHAHHLVPQHPANLEKFGVVQADGRLVAPRLHSTDNVIWMPAMLQRWRRLFVTGTAGSGLRHAGHG